MDIIIFRYDMIFYVCNAIQGDSGGPLTYKDGAQHILIGDVSFGDGCAKAGRYGVYGRISYYRNWLDSKMTMAKYCSHDVPVHVHP